MIPCPLTGVVTPGSIERLMMLYKKKKANVDTFHININILYGGGGI